MFNRSGLPSQSQWCIPDRVVRRANTFSERIERDEDRWSSLSAHEHATLTLADQHLSNKLIAAELDKSERQIERWVSSAAIKLGVPKGQGKAQAVRAYRQLAQRVGNSDVGFTPVDPEPDLDQHQSQDAIELPLGLFQDPVFRGSLEQNIFASRLEAMDAVHGMAPRVLAVAVLLIGLPVAFLLLAALAVLVSTALR